MNWNDLQSCSILCSTLYLVIVMGGGASGGLTRLTTDVDLLDLETGEICPFYPLPNNLGYGAEGVYTGIYQ
jgi:hypothetical protein